MHKLTSNTSEPTPMDIDPTGREVLWSPEDDVNVVNEYKIFRWSIYAVTNHTKLKLDIFAMT